MNSYSDLSQFVFIENCSSIDLVAVILVLIECSDKDSAGMSRSERNKQYNGWRH